LVIDGQPMIRIGVRGVLGDRYEVEEADDPRGGLELVTIGDFDVAIVELAARANGRPESEHGIAAIRALREARPGLGIVAHDARPQHHAAAEAIDAGATAYVAKSSPAESLAQAVEAAASAETFVDPAAKARHRSRVGLTRRQREILQLFSDGHSTARVAKRLGLSTETVRTHTKAILARLEARDRAHAVAIALRGGLID
jgi:two-component system, NarL family, response regulator